MFKLKIKQLLCGHPKHFITKIDEISHIQLIGKEKNFFLTINLCNKCYKVISKFYSPQLHHPFSESQKKSPNKN